MLRFSKSFVFCFDFLEILLEKHPSVCQERWQRLQKPLLEYVLQLPKAELRKTHLVTSSDGLQPNSDGLNLIAMASST